MAGGIGQAPAAPIKLPPAESATASLGIPRRRGVAGFAPPQHRPDARQKLPQPERLGDVVVGSELQPDHPVDLVAAMAGRDDDRNIGVRTDLTEQIETVLLAKPQIEDYKVGLAPRHQCRNLVAP